MKSALNALEIATGTGRYNAGDASSASLSGTAGFHAFRATYHLIDDALDCGGELLSIASSLANLLSQKIGKALSEVDSVTRSAVGVIGDAISLLDKSVLGVTAAQALWVADQTFEAWLQDFLESGKDEIARLAGLYLTVRKKGLCGGTKSEPKPPMSPLQRLKDRHGITSVAVNAGAQRALAPPPTIRPTAPSGKSLSPLVVVGGAAAVAAALLLVK